MEKGLRNTFIGIIATFVITFVGAWIQINSRIAILETQMRLYGVEIDTDDNLIRI